MSPKLPRVTASALIHAVQRDGWRKVRQQGSHVIFEHPTKPGMVIVPLHKGKELRTGTVARILKDAGLTLDELGGLL